MAYEREYGKIAGLRERLDDWSERLSSDPSLPWVGLGLIDDLQAMGRYMDGERTDPVSVDEGPVPGTEKVAWDEPYVDPEGACMVCEGGGCDACRPAPEYDL